MSGIKRGILTQIRHKRLFAFVMAVLISILSVPVYSGEIKVKAADARPNFQFKSKEYVSDKPTDVNVDLGHVYYPNEGTGPFPVLILVHGSGGYSTSGYVNQIVKWIRHGEVSPMVIITPNLQKTRYWQEFVHCNNKNIGGERELLGDLIKRIENGTYDSLTGVKLDKENISLCGWSMGGGTAIYGGCYYNDKIVNIGALSPTPYVHTNWSLYGGTDWLDNDEKTKDHKFTTRADKHLFLAASET